MPERNQALEQDAVRDAAPAYRVNAPVTGQDDVPPGYKWTEVGMIPEDWLVCELRDLLRFPPSYGINAPAVRFDESLPTYIRITDIDEHGRFSPNPSVSVKHHNANQYCLEHGDVVFARTGASVGKSYEYNLDDGPLVYAGFLISVSPDPDRLDSTFLANYCKTQKYWSWVKSVSLRSGQPGINGSEYGSLPIPTPDIYEQRAIAAALSDADALIESLDRLIAKKRAIKQAAMQQLLTGQTRLPGFTGEWEMKRLGDLGSTYGGLTGKTKADFGSGEGLYVTFLNILSNTVIDCTAFEQVAVSSRESQNTVAKGDLFFTGSSETPEEVGMCAVLQDNVDAVYVNSFCFGFRLSEKAPAVPLYMAYYFRSQQGREIFKSLAQGATRYNLSKTALMDVMLTLPKPDEQTAIATVLADMDTEIEALERRRDKARQIKQGMMQQLLTGRVRLVEPEMAV